MLTYLYSLCSQVLFLIFPEYVLKSVIVTLPKRLLCGILYDLFMFQHFKNFVSIQQEYMSIWIITSYKLMQVENECLELKYFRERTGKMLGQDLMVKKYVNVPISVLKVIVYWTWEIEKNYTLCKRPWDRFFFHTFKALLVGKSSGIPRMLHSDYMLKTHIKRICSEDWVKSWLVLGECFIFIVDLNKFALCVISICTYQLPTVFMFPGYKLCPYSIISRFFSFILPRVHMLYILWKNT